MPATRLAGNGRQDLGVDRLILRNKLSFTPISSGTEPARLAVVTGTVA